MRGSLNYIHIFDSFKNFNFVKNDEVLNKINDLKVIDYDKTFDYVWVEPPYTITEISDDIHNMFVDSTFKKLKSSRKSLPIDDLIISQDILERNNLMKLYNSGSIKKPLDVLKLDDKFYLIDGNHRYTIHKLKGEESVDCIVYDADTIL